MNRLRQKKYCKINVPGTGVEPAHPKGH